MRLARCLSPLNFKLSPVGRELQLDGWPPIHVLILKKLGTHLSRVVVVGLSRVLRVFLRVLRFSWSVVVWRLPKAPSICLSTWRRWSASFVIQPIRLQVRIISPLSLSLYIYITKAILLVTFSTSFPTLIDWPQMRFLCLYFNSSPV